MSARRRAAIGVALVLASLVHAGAAASAAGEARMQGDRLLVVTPAGARASADELAALLADRLRLRVRVVSNAEYAPIVDERAHDGIVYFGCDYDDPPKQGLLDDVARTRKPVLWINYHAWLLAPELLGAQRLRIEDRHSDRFDALAFLEVAPLLDADTTWVEAPRESVLFWLYDATRTETLPGAVVSDGFAFLSYCPSLDPGAADAPALAAVARGLFGAPGSAPASTPTGPFDERVRAARADPFWSGVHLAAYASHGEPEDGRVGYDSDRLHANLVRIAASGAEWVTLGQIFWQDGIRAAEVRADEDATATFESLADVVGDAHRLGLRVRLSPIVNLSEASRRPGQWRGMIRPRDAGAWWSSYRGQILRAAEFARDHEVESLHVGAELGAMQSDAEQWRALVSAVRREVGYRGLVGYQVNYDALEPLAWADALDYVAVAAYWPLAGTRGPSLDELSEAWREAGATLGRFVREHPGARVEFGEVGYASQPYAAVFPYSWKPHKGRAQDLEEQLQCYRALERFVADHPEIAGVHFFASTLEDQDPGSIGYTPFGKPAERVMERIIGLR